MNPEIFYRLLLQNRSILPILILISERKLQVSEYIEGTYIHLFYDTNIASWEIATKKAVGGNYSYYHIPEDESLTYREMFIEACGLSYDSDLQDIPFLAKLDTRQCYGFVLQHPTNHIVMNISTPKLYLVSIYKIDRSTSEITYISQTQALNPFYNKNNFFFRKPMIYRNIQSKNTCVFILPFIHHL